jgi:O-antigen/teichoic acid export membrane protein
MQAVDIIVSAAVLGFAARNLLVWPRFSRRAFNDLWPLSLGYTINQPFSYAAYNADRFIIGRGLGTATLGIYTRASFFANTATTLFGNISRLSVFPAMSKVQHDETRLRSALLKSFSVLALLTLPICAFCVIFAPEIIDLLLGGQWHAAVVPFAILSGTLYFTLAWRDCATLFQALGHPYWMTAAHICRAAALIAGIWWIAPRGLTAICAVIGVVMALMLGIMFMIVKYAIHLPLRSIAAAHFNPLLVTAAASGLCLTLKALLPAWPGTAVLLLALALLLSSACAFVFFNRSASSARPAFWRYPDHISEDDETYPSHRHTKTGTSAVQRFLCANRQRLAESDVHYAHASWFGAGECRRNALSTGDSRTVRAFLVKQVKNRTPVRCPHPSYLRREFLRKEHSRCDAAKADCAARART